MGNSLWELYPISDQQCKFQQHSKPQWQPDWDRHSHWHGCYHRQWDSD